MHAQGFQESTEHKVDSTPKDKVSSDNKIPNKNLSHEGYQLKDTSRNEIYIHWNMPNKRKQDTN